MKTLKKTLCITLSILMVFSCFSFAVSAQDEETVSASLKYYTEKSNSYNADVVLDTVDEALAQLNDGNGFYFEIIEGVSVDLRSVTALCGTLDLLKRVLVSDNIFDIATTALIKKALGTLGEDINLKNWTTGMSRPDDDIAILTNLIAFMGDNSAVINGIIRGNYDMGVVNNFINIDEMIGPEGISGMLKEMIFGMVYEKDSPEFAAAYETYKTDIDAFIYGPLLTKFADQYLPGFTMDASSTVEDLICVVFSIAVDKYLVENIKDLDISFSDSDNEKIRALDSIVNLKGSTYDLSGLVLDSSKPLLDQLNGLFGEIAKQMVPSYNGWVSGGYGKIADNLENISKYVATESGLIPDAYSMSLEELALEGIRITVENANLGAYETDLADCSSLEEAATVFLRNTAYAQGIGVSYTEDDSYLVILGDMLAYTAYNYINIKDLNSKSYQAGGGKDVFEVANYILNYFLFDKGVANVMGLSTTKSESFFTKVDKMLDYFGETKSKGVSFNTQQFIYGSSNKKGLIESVFTLDLTAILNLTVVPALNTAGNVSAVEFLYKSIQYFCNNWAGKTMLPAYRQKAFTNALEDTNIATMISAALQTLSARKASTVTLLSFIGALLLKEEYPVYSITEAKINDCIANGNVIFPTGSVRLDGKSLTAGKDFIIVTDAKTPGAATAKIKFIGIYSGEAERSFNVNFAPISSLSFTSNTNTIKLVWSKVPYADGYNVYMLKNGSWQLLNSELLPTNEYYIYKLNTASEYSFKVEAVSAAYGTSTGKQIAAATKPAAVSSPITVATNASQVKLTWKAVANATDYKIEKYAGNNKWEQIAITSGTSYLISGLAGYTEYNFRITAMKKTSSGEYAIASPTSVKAKTKLGAISNLTVSYTSTSITISWPAVKNAQTYQVLRLQNGKWVQAAAVTGTSYKATGLKVSTKYTYAVRAAVKENGTWIFGGYKSVEQYTGLAKPSSFKVSATNATQAKLTWSKVANAKGYQVFRYIDGKWVSLGTTKNTTVTISNLPSGTKNYFKVRAFTTVNGNYLFGDVAGHITALTLPGKVSGFKVVHRKTNELKFSWSKVTGAAGYEVFRYHNGKWVSLGKTTATNWTDKKSLSRSTTYQYRVRAVQKVGSAYKNGAASATFKIATTTIGTAYR